MDLEPNAGETLCLSLLLHQPFCVFESVKLCWTEAIGYNEGVFLPKGL
jgi:hypothetical protein